MKISLNKVNKSFNNRPNILDKLNQNFESARINVIFGRSGSGKSTLLKCLCGVENIDQGSLKYGNVEINKLNAKERAAFRLKNIGFVYQFFHLLPSLTVNENIQLPLKLLKQKNTKKYAELINMLGIEHIQKAWPDTLSGGEAQRVALCRALITNPPVILADEPTGNLDQKNRDLIINHFNRLAKEEKKTIIIVTHDSVFTEITEHIYDLQGGKLVHR
eukprot:COSAG01_NODE_52_length_31456_cov_125.226648_25_plen_218_part_00